MEALEGCNVSFMVNISKYVKEGSLESSPECHLNKFVLFI